MARVLMTNLISSITGRFGGGVFRNWKGLTVLSALPDSVDNPSSSAQANAREILSYCSKQWAGLDDTTRGGWEGVAAQLSEQWDHFSNEVGTKTVIVTPRGPFTAIGALCSVHGLLASVDAWDTADVLQTPPAGKGAPVAPTDCAFTQDPVSGNVTVTWTDPTEWGQGATDGYVRVWLRSENGIYHRQLVGSAAGGVETLTFDRLRTANGGQSTVAPGWTIVQLDAVNEFGLRSAPAGGTTGDLAEPLQP
jgi:hypothetical protein